MTKEHWESVYRTKPTDQVSWFQTHASTSVRLIEATGIGHQAAIIDVGSGASRLLDELWAAEFRNLTALDISLAALQASQQRLGATVAAAINWQVGDVLTQQLPKQHFSVWHDRAVFHFLTQPQQQQQYVEQVRNALEPDGYVVIATFAEDGPERCSGLPVRRYSAEQLAQTFGDGFECVHAERESHRTPAGNEQKFLYCVLRRL